MKDKSFSRKLIKPITLKKTTIIHGYPIIHHFCIVLDVRIARIPNHARLPHRMQQYESSLFGHLRLLNRLLQDNTSLSKIEEVVLAEEINKKDTSEAATFGSPMHVKGL